MIDRITAAVVALAVEVGVALFWASMHEALAAAHAPTVILAGVGAFFTLTALAVGLMWFQVDRGMRRPF